MDIQKNDSTVRRFNAIHWHDSKLLGLQFSRIGGEDQVRVTVLLREPQGPGTPVVIVFTESTYIALEVDLEGKRLCSDDISGAECHLTSEWLRTLSERNPDDNFGGYLHFEIGLIPPGGTINILAKDFVVESTP